MSWQPIRTVPLNKPVLVRGGFLSHESSGYRNREPYTAAHVVATRQTNDEWPTFWVENADYYSPQVVGPEEWRPLFETEE